MYNQYEVSDIIDYLQATFIPAIEAEDMLVIRGISNRGT